MLCCVVCVLLILVILDSYKKKEGLLSRPSQNEKARMVKEIMNNEELIKAGKLNRLKEDLPWMDAILYEDLRSVIHEHGKLEESLIIPLLS